MIPDLQREPVSRWPRDGGGSFRSVIMASRPLHPRGGQANHRHLEPPALTSIEKIED